VARITPIRLLRTTQANLDSQGGSSNLLEGEPYWITDEGRLAVGTGTGSYTEIGPFRYPPRATKTAAATTDFVLDGTAYTCQLDTDITTWTTSLPSGGNAANFEYSCRIDFTPPASGTYTVTIPGGAKLVYIHRQLAAGMRGSESAPAQYLGAVSSGPGTLSLTPLNLQQGDLVVVLGGEYSDGSNLSRPNSWVRIDTLYNYYNSSLWVYKIMGSSPDSSVDIGLNSSLDGGIVAVAFRPASGEFRDKSSKRPASNDSYSIGNAEPDSLFVTCITFYDIWGEFTAPSTAPDTDYILAISKSFSGGYFACALAYKNGTTTTDEDPGPWPNWPAPYSTLVQTVSFAP